MPNLDIRTNDVKCSQASTVGPIDDDQALLPRESRGVPPETAGATRRAPAFFEEVLDQLPSGQLADELRAAVADKLNLQGGAS